MSGTTLIVDRYSYSGIAFSSAKGLDFQWCKVKKMVKIVCMPTKICFTNFISFSHVGSRGWVVGPRFGGLPGHFTRGNATDMLLP